MADESEGSMTRTTGDSTFRLKAGRATHHSNVKRLFCIACGSTQDARRVGRSSEYTLACGHIRALLTSEKAQERMEQGAEPCLD